MVSIMVIELGLDSPAKERRRVPDRRITFQVDTYHDVDHLPLDQLDAIHSDKGASAAEFPGVIEKGNKGPLVAGGGCML